MSIDGHDHHDYVHTMYSSVPRAAARLMGKGRPAALYVWNFLIFGLPLWLIYNYGFFTTFSFGGPDDLFYGLLYMAALWMWIGPLLICWWEQRYVAFLRQICLRTGSCVTESEAALRVVTYYRRTAVYWGLMMAVAAAILFVAYLPHVPPVQILYEKPFMLVTSFLVVMVAAFMSGYGWAGALHTILLFKNLEKLGLKWEPLDGDEAGGFVFLGEFCVKTTAAFSVGTIILPYIIQAGRYVSSYFVFWGYFLTVAYSVLIVLSFAVPLFFAVRMARLNRSAYLGVLGDRIGSIVQFSEPARLEAIRHDHPQIAWVEMLLNVDGKVRATSIMPFSPTSVAKVAILALAPFVSTAVRYIIQIF